MTTYKRRFAKRMVAMRSAKRRRSSPRLPRSRGPKPALWKPLPCWVLAVDAARDSGWALYYAGVLLESGSCNIDDAGEDELARVCRRALGWTDPYAPPGRPRMRETVLVFERPFKSGHVSAYVGIGAAQGAWKRAWVLAGGGKTRVVRVHAATWRARILGAGRGLTREQWKALAVARVRAMYPGTAAQDDEAEAILIGVCASFMAEVKAKLPKRVREAA